MEITRRHAVLLGIFGAWIGFGLIGREPWKPDEAYTFGLVLHILRSGEWIVPMLAGEPFVEKPPLFFVTAAAFASVFGHWLPLHDAARLASGFFVTVTLLLTSATARTLYGPRSGAAASLLLIGCLGYVMAGHYLITDNALMAGMALGMFGLAKALRKPVVGGFLLGSGAGVAFMAKGLLGPGLLAVSALALALLPPWRKRQHIATMLAALLACAPWLLVWPWLLYRESSALFDEWFWVNNLNSFVGHGSPAPGSDHLEYLRTLPWFALPALPLAAWTWWRARVAREPLPAETLLPLVVFGVMFGVLSAAGSARGLYALPMLLPLALLAAAHTGAGRSRLAAWFELVAVWGAAGFAAVVWTGWLASLAGWPAAFAKLLERSNPGFVPSADFSLVLAALVVTGGWVLVLRTTRSSPDDRMAARWAASVALVWGLSMTLALPYADRAKGYSALIADFKRALPATEGCISRRGVGEPQRALLDYYAGVRTVAEGDPRWPGCDLLLVQTGRGEAPAMRARWTLLWSGSRPGDDKERLWLFARASDKS